MSSRSFVCTIYALDKVPTLGKHIRYVVWQLEECPETLKKHYQVYAELNEPKRGSHLQKIWGVKCHFEKRKGTRDEARAYSMKEETRIDGPWELGKWEAGGQGKRTDINSAVAMIKEGKKYIHIINELPEVFVKYHRGLEKVKNVLLQETKDFRSVQVNVLWGKAGSGKTREAVENGKDYYILSNDADTVWWDGYDGEDTLIIDDFYGWIKYSLLLKVLDGYQLRLPIKGGHTYARWTKVFITSNDKPCDWYGRGMTQALERRLTKIKEF